MLVKYLVTFLALFAMACSGVGADEEPCTFDPIVTDIQYTWQNWGTSSRMVLFLFLSPQKNLRQFEADIVQVLISLSFFLLPIPPKQQ